MSTRTPVVRTSRRDAVVAAVTAVAAAGAIAACGSSSNNNSSSGSSSGAAATNVNAALTQAKQVLQQGATRPSNITVSTPIGKPIPSGKKLVFISCGAAQCQLQGNIVKEAA